jgi:hypothetical protein
MPSAKYSISNPSAIIALKYGKNVSRGIIKMESIINGQSMALELLTKKDDSHPAHAAKDWIPDYCKNTYCPDCVDSDTCGESKK